MDKTIRHEKEDDLQGLVEWYQEEIIRMAKGVRKLNSIKMLYGFSKRLYINENTGD